MARDVPSSPGTMPRGAHVPVGPIDHCCAASAETISSRCFPRRGGREHRLIWQTSGLQSGRATNSPCEHRVCGGPPCGPMTSDWSARRDPHIGVQIPVLPSLRFPASPARGLPARDRPIQVVLDLNSLSIEVISLGRRRGGPTPNLRHTCPNPPLPHRSPPSPSIHPRPRRLGGSIDATPTGPCSSWPGS